MTNKQCYKVVSSVDTLFSYEKEFSVTCETVKYKDETVVFYSDNETRIEASFYRPFSVEYDSRASSVANMSQEDRSKYYRNMLVMVGND